MMQRCLWAGLVRCSKLLQKPAWHGFVCLLSFTCDVVVCILAPLLVVRIEIPQISKAPPRRQCGEGVAEMPSGFSRSGKFILTWRPRMLRAAHVLMLGDMSVVSCCAFFVHGILSLFCCLFFFLSALLDGSLNTLYRSTAWLYL